MPRNSSGTYALPAGNPVVTNTLIQSTWANTTLSDVSTAMTDSLDRNGRGAMLAPLKNIDGTATAPSISFSSEGTMGIYRAAAGTIGFAVGGALVLSLTAAGLTFTAPIVLPIGTAAAPSLAFIANTNTGIYSPGTNQFAITTNGAQRLGVDAAGTVNIVSGQLLLQGAGANTIQAAAGAGSLAFQTGGANTRVTIDSAGNVTMIGTLAIGASLGLANAQAITWKDAGTTSRRGAVLSAASFYFGDIDNAIASSATLLRANAQIEFDVNNSSVMSMSATSVSVTRLLFVASGAGEQIRLGNDSGFLAGYNTANTTRTGYLQFTAGGGVTLSNDQAQSLFLATSAITRMTIDASGFVGMGIAPISTVKLAMSDGTITTLLAFNYSANTVSGIGTNTAHALGFLTSGTERVRIDTSGNLLVGTAAAGFGAAGRGLVEVNGSTTALVGYKIAGVSAGYLYHDGTNMLLNNLNATGSLTLYTNGIARLAISGGGNVSIGGALTISGITTSTASESLRTANDSGFISFFNTANNTRTGYLQGNAGANVSLTSETASLVLACSTGTINLQTSSTNRLTISSGGVIADGAGLELGWKDIPTNSQAGPYTLVVGDRGKLVQCGATGVTVPASVFSQGAVVTIFNNSASAQTITQGASVTLYYGATGGTGNRALSARGIATVVCLASNTFVITGAGLT